MAIKLIYKFLLILFIIIGCNNSIKRENMQIPDKKELLNMDSSFDIKFLDKVNALKPPILKEKGDRIRLKIINLRYRDTLFFNCVMDSIIPSFGYESTKFYDGRNNWGFNSNTSGIYATESPYINHILPRQSQIVIYHLSDENNSSDSVGIGFDCLIGGKTYGEITRFKNK